MASSAGLDRTGVWASILCAVHCGAAPFLLLAAPWLGGVWSHPASHVAIAALVLPVAAIALVKGFRAHGRTRVVGLGIAGMSLIVVGAVLPGFGSAGEDTGACADDCCPSFAVDEQTGERTLRVPPASIVTLAGGILLVATHLINLRCCAGCRPTTPV